MKKYLLLLAVFFTCQTQAADYYWVGGAGNWSDLNHWRLGSSGGSIPSIVPSSGDNVFFDANSGFAPGSIKVSLNANAFCNNMTWGNVQNSPQFVNTSTAFNIQVNGNIVLNPTTYYEAMFVFTGSSNAILTSGGTVVGQFGMYIDKGTGSLTVTDSLVVPNVSTTPVNVTVFNSGTFNIAGKKMLVYSFGSQNDNVRTLEMTNATVICNSGTNSGFKVTGLNKTVNTAGSTVLAYGYNTDEGLFKNVTITSGNGPNTIFVNNSTIGKLTFAAAAGSLFSNIGSNNHIDTVIFNEAGGIGYNYGGGNQRISSNNTVGYVKFAKSGQLNGAGNVIGKIECLNSFLVNTNSTTNTVDSLILAPNRNTNFFGTFNINKYLFVSGAPCEAYTEVYGDSTAGTVNFAAGAVVNINNVILTGVKATGPVTPVAMNGIDGGGNTGFIITEPSGTGTTLYWVGGAGDWNDKSHWSFTSGGTGGACVPFKNDNVVFDANSSLAGRIVTTSSNTFCKDLTWAAGVGTTTFTQGGYTFRIYGSVMMQSSVTYSTSLAFVGIDASTLTTNGGGTGNFSFSIAKTGSGSLTLVDNWINATSTGNISYSSGGLNMAGRTVTCWIFSSNTSGVRNLDISNATITTNSQWIYVGANKSMTAAGSHIISNGIFQSNNPNSSYPWVDITYAGGGSSVSGTTIGQLTFTNASVGSGASILSGNTIRRAEFKGAATIGNTAGNNNIDSLILAGSRNYTFLGTNTITKYMLAQATPCSGLTEMRGSPATLAFQSTADIHIDNVYLQSMTATGIMTPIAINGADAGGNTGWSFTAIPGGPRYWIGGAGDWNDNTHWSMTSGGASGACVPTVSNDVYFDAASGFTAGSKTVTVNNGNAYARNVNWTGAANAPVWSQSGSWSIEIWGDSILLPLTGGTFNTAVTLKGTNTAFLKNTVSGNFDAYIDKPGAGLTLLNNFSNAATDIALVNGTLKASGLTLLLSSINNNTAPNNVMAIDISNSRITAGTWRYLGTAANHTLNATNTVISAGAFAANGLQYDTVNVSGNSSASATIGGTTINKITFTDPSTVSAAGINGNSNTLGIVDYKGAGGIYGSGNVMNTLIFFPGNRYTISAGTNNTITNAWYGSGTPCRPTEIVSSGGTNATLTKNGNPVSFDYVRLQRITAAGSAAPFTAQKHSTDLGNNANWNIAPYDGASPIYGLGPDTSILPGHFPYTLRTTGFFGAPGSQYTWNNSSTADTLRVPGPGTYSVSVSFPDGCAIKDTITLSTLIIPLPVTLMSFTAKVIDCQSHLQWKVTGTAHVGQYVAERSTDGYSYTPVAILPHIAGITDYSYTDEAAGGGKIYYRLQLVGTDAKANYSPVVPVYSDCVDASIRVYPTVTGSNVKVALSSGYQNARLYLVNAMGQRIVPAVSDEGPVKIVSLQGLTAGTYMLQVVHEGMTQTFRVEKQ